MKAISAKRLAQLRQYTPARRAFLRANPICQVCAKRRSLDVHHKAGREGRLLLDESQWLAVCRTCHDKIHSEPRWAREQGYKN